jgi:hypothetical protein
MRSLMSPGFDIFGTDGVGVHVSADVVQFTPPREWMFNIIVPPLKLRHNL